MFVCVWVGVWVHWQEVVKATGAELVLTGPSRAAQVLSLSLARSLARSLACLLSLSLSLSLCLFDSWLEFVSGLGSRV